MFAFAANSVLCRLALGSNAIDAASFSLIRLIAGAIVLLSISVFSAAGIPSLWTRANGWGAGLLATYMLGFSFAYVSLDAGTGALVLFGSVQLTMLLVALWQGSRPAYLEWSGWLLALAGMMWLTLPGATAPAPAGSLLMAIAGVAWGFYSLRGRRVSRPLPDTTANFVLATLVALLPCLFWLDSASLSWKGVLLAIASGAIASGVGYAVWYAVLPYLSILRAALLQLSVPVLAAMGGVMFIAEPLAPRLLVSGFMVLAGIAVAIAGKQKIQRLK